MPAASITGAPNRHTSPPNRHSGESRNLRPPPHHHSRGCTAPESGASRNDGCRGAENGKKRRRTAVNRNITIRLDALTIPHRRPNPRHTFRTPARPATTASHPNHPQTKLPCPPAAFPTRPCSHIHRHTNSPHRHSGSLHRHSGASRNLRLAGSTTDSYNRHSGESRNDGCRSIAMTKTHAGLWQIAVRPHALNHPISPNYLQF